MSITGGPSGDDTSASFGGARLAEVALVGIPDLERDPDDAHGRRWSPARIIAALVGLSVVARAPGWTTSRLFDTDESFIVVSARVVRGGDDPYFAAIDRKPPLPALVTSLWAELPGATPVMLARLAVAIGIGLSAALLATHIRDTTGSPRVGFVAGALFVVSTVWLLPWDGQSANYVTWGLPFALSSILLAERARRASNRPGARCWLWFWAGLLAAGSVLCKQTYVFNALALATIWSGLGHWRSRVQAAVSAALGVITALSVISLWVSFEEMIRWTLVDNADYVRGVAPHSVAARAVTSSLLVGILLLPVVVVAWVGRPLLRERVWAAWLAGSVAGVGVGLRFFGHYYLQLLPVLAVLGAEGLRRAGPRGRRFVIGAAIAWTAATMTGAVVARPSAPPTELVEVVRSTSDHDDRVLVWARNPAVLVFADRAPGLPFLHGAFLTGEWALADAPARLLGDDAALAERWAYTVRDFAADPPQLLLDYAGASTEWTRWTLSETPLARFLHDYEPIGKIDGVGIWKRKLSHGSTTEAISWPPGCSAGLDAGC